MQRYWFLEDKSSIVSIVEPPEPEIEYCKWTFKVQVLHNLNKNIVIGLMGDCESLANWNINKSIVLTRETGTNYYSTDVTIPIINDNIYVNYRYFLICIDPRTAMKTEILSESPVKNRIIQLRDENPITDDIFGVITNTLYQFKFSDNPFELKNTIKERNLYVKITPIDLRNKIGNDSIANVNLDELVRGSKEMIDDDLILYAYNRVFTSKLPDNIIEYQPKFGEVYNQSDTLFFIVSVPVADSALILIDFYGYSRKAEKSDPPYHMGYQYILPKQLDKPEGGIMTTITCATRHRQLGTMKFEYVKISPKQPLMDVTIDEISNKNNGSANEIERMFNLEIERQLVAMSTASSIQSLMNND